MKKTKTNQLEISQNDLREFFPEKQDVPRGTFFEKRNPKFSNQHNQHLFNHPKESRKTPGQTIPDQALTIKQIMDRFARGLPMGGGQTPVYNGEDDVLEGIDPRKLDLTERAEIQQRVADEIKQTVDAYKKRNQSPIKAPKALETIPTNVDPEPTA